MRVVHSIECPEIGPICQQRPEPPQLHDQTFWVAELRAIAELQLWERLSVEAQLPLRLSATTVRYLRPDGTPFELDYEDIHHRNETLVGLGDPWLSVRGRLEALEILFAGQAGTTLPLGRTEPDPFALGDLGLAHQHVQFGTGTFQPLLGLEALRHLGPVDLRAHAVAQVSIAQNHHGYQAGTRIAGGLEAAASLDRWRVRGGVNVFHEEPERWSGIIQQDGNLGRTDVLVGASVAYPFGELSVEATVQVPVYQRIIHGADEDGQLTYPAILGISVQRLFGP